MKSLDVKIHGRNKASILDLSASMLNLADNKWTPMFDICNQVFEKPYFIGVRKQYLDEDFENTIEYISEKIFLVEKEYYSIILKIKPAFLQLNRSLFNKLWVYFEFPSLIYLGDERDENWLINAYKHNAFHEDIVRATEEVLIIYRLTQENVIWIQAGFDVNKVLSFIDDEY